MFGWCCISFSLNWVTCSSCSLSNSILRRPDQLVLALKPTTHIVLLHSIILVREASSQFPHPLYISASKVPLLIQNGVTSVNAPLTGDWESLSRIYLSLPFLSASHYPYQ
jgi:hypothetical protein